jgi:hypothetical protein
MYYDVIMNEITHRFVPVILIYPYARIMCQYDRSDPIRYKILIGVECMGFGSRK